MQKLNISSHGIYTELYDGLKNGSPAYSKGLYFLGVYMGGIFISKDIALHILELTEEEFDFIIAHELSHIVLQHYPTSIILELPNVILTSIKEDWAKITKLSIDLIRLMLILKGSLPPKENIKKNQEIEADIQAVYLTYNKVSAMSCLRKLAKGNIFCGSHHSKIFNTDFPILYFNERISAIEQLQL
ncbi:MAG: M48 family metalloprotease [Candidatus Pacearchaeota archaeon]|nr:MAG: M48 family metalloprotease [Candidatus Pacearchaeota archaeon]